MTTDSSLFSLLVDASFLVQVVMLALLVVSLISWTVIFRKRKVMKKAHAAADDFDAQFWSGEELIVLYRQLDTQENPSGMERIFLSGFREFAKLRRQTDIELKEVLEASRRAMRVSLNREIDTLETHLPFLATTGSTSPYVGLFGTVWGIMNSFRALGNVNQATISMVAPGISEALIATAMGLFAAIPAVIAYNHYANDIDRLAVRYDTFSEEFLAILQRQARR
uniref:Tol-Pal system protein TolQ n=2 Tax=unclassified Candidatus Kentrum TaxID=2643149 RepID=A0A451ASA7_9GAMM|nr:MAG: Cell division and transport-associated protein TolQ [Candidatus Kentron sp. LPFa]VFK23441.1 MAG: Cell division and transport-associated protein TolQ [Candidatus Kentron sp. LPFa]VFK58441.1 MAG: Cell division and transport-associated protein TolQ [Candidatus Kentron sp. UNK]VFK68877.1 MAG: Cell division and transport-associated protein TolQ [Candidatus Kentron sp. UNK]